MSSTRDHDTIMGEVRVTEARLSDVSSLATIVPRSFHPVNPYIRKVFPDTERMRQWWSTIFTDEINNSKCNVVTAVNASTGKAIGALTMRKMDPSEEGSGLWSMYDLTEDHDAAAYKPMIDGMTEHRERLMLGKAHFLIELFGVDDAYKGRQLGKKLLSRACGIADEAGHEIFVQANASARSFYGKLGFKQEGYAVMPGEAKYEEFMLVRPVQSK